MIHVSDLPVTQLRSIAQKWEKFGRFLPRPCLDWAEIYALPEPISDSTLQENLSFWRTRRVALVKQTAYHALYLRTDQPDWKKTVLSSYCHLGPFSLLAELGADYHIVRQAKEPETFRWKDKYAYDPDPEASCRRRLEEVRELESSHPGNSFISVDDVNWSKYDLVIALDVPIPERIIRKCPRTLWSYYSIEAGGPLQKNSLIRPMSGYQLFLNHGFRRYRTRPRNRNHVLEFPLQFQSPEAWRALRQAVQPGDNRSCILVEKNSWVDPMPASRTPIDRPTGEALEYLRKMFSAMACLHTTNKTRWGNWAVEAVLSGSVFLGNAGSLAQISPLLPDLDSRTLADGISRANALIESPLVWEAVQRLQTKIVDHVAFRRPLADLTRQAQEFFA